MIGDQIPLHTGYGPFATADDMAEGIDLKGKSVIVTGGASGLGRESVRVLAQCGASIIVPARDPISAAAALAGIPNVSVLEMDLLDPDSIDWFASEFLANNRRLEVLVLSAGVMATPLFRDAQGHEGQFSTNHLGHFRLVSQLWPALMSSGNSRVVVVSSRGHQIGGLDLSDLDFLKRPYNKWLAYGQAKTANALFAVALDARGREHGIHAYSLHPGSILSPLARHLTREEIDAFGAVKPDGTPVIDPSRDMKTIEQGAATIVWCAIAPELATKGGVYCEDCDIAPIEREERFGVRPEAIDPATAEALWVESVRLTEATRLEPHAALR